MPPIDIKIAFRLQLNVLQLIFYALYAVNYLIVLSSQWWLFVLI